LIWFELGINIPLDLIPFDLFWFGAREGVQGNDDSGTGPQQRAATGDTGMVVSSQWAVAAMAEHAWPVRDLTRVGFLPISGYRSGSGVGNEWLAKGRTGPSASALIRAARENGRVGQLGWLAGQTGFNPTTKEYRKKAFHLFKSFLEIKLLFKFKFKL
jgi:hypothetical protein